MNLNSYERCFAQIFYKIKVVHGCQFNFNELGMFSNVKELMIYAQLNSFIGNKSKEVFIGIAR
jgi:hypothetical protein